MTDQVRFDQFDKILEEALSGKPHQGRPKLPYVRKIENSLEALTWVAKCYPYAHGCYDIQGPDGTIYYPRVFVETGGMGSAFTGAGAVLTSDGRVYEFRMCEHVWDESGANHSRGWHPRRCKLCKLDLSIDSGD